MPLFVILVDLFIRRNQSKVTISHFRVRHSYVANIRYIVRNMIRLYELFIYFDSVFTHLYIFSIYVISLFFYSVE